MSTTKLQLYPTAVPLNLHIFFFFLYCLDSDLDRWASFSAQKVQTTVQDCHSHCCFDTDSLELSRITKAAG